MEGNMSKHTNHRDPVKKVSVSQNFLTNRKLLERIVTISNINKQDTVIEIGTGKGHLTRTLCRKCRRLYSIEIDKSLYEQAKNTLSGCENLKLICGDFLDYRLPSGTDYKIFANIPFFITTKIIRKLTETANPPQDIWIIVEKGAAKRFMGKNRETMQSLFLKPGWNTEIAWHFRRSDFHPMPAVDCVLLHLARKKSPDLSKKEYREFRHFVEHSMKYGLFGKQSLLTRKQINTALKREKLPPLTPGGEILYIQWLCLFRCYQKMRQVNG